MPNTFELSIPTTPEPKGRARILKNGRTYTPKKTASSQRLIAHYFMEAFSFEPFECAVSMEIHIYLKKPKSAKKRVYPHVKPDIDNYVKTIMDAANKAGIWKDDSLVVHLTASKNYLDDDTKDSYTRIKITALQPEPTLL